MVAPRAAREPVFTLTQPFVKASARPRRMSAHACTGHRSGHRQHRLRARPWRRNPPGCAGPRHHPDPAGGRAGAAAGRHPRADRRTAGRAPAGGAGHRGTVFRRQRPHRVRRRPGPRGDPPGRRPARRAVAVLHPSAGQGGGVRQRPGRQGPGGPDDHAPTRPPGRPSGDHAGPHHRRPGGGHLRSQPGAAGAGGGKGVIALISGKVAVRRGDHVVVDCGGVGYRLAVSAETLKHVPAAGREVMLHTHLVVRDDALALYGFATEEERELFLMLLGVQAVGPKVALAVLSGAPPRELLATLAAGDTGRLQAVPGIGKRTAERIVVELREKVADTALAPVITVTRTEDPRSLARAGLVELGYSGTEADALLEGVDGERTEDLISHALRSARR